MKNIYYILVLILISCNIMDTQTINSDDIFQYDTTANIVYNIKTKTNSVNIKIYADNNLVLDAVSNNSGVISGELSLPIGIKEVILKTDFIGLISEIVVPITENKIFFDYSKQQNIDNKSTNNITFSYRSYKNVVPDTLAYKSLGSWNNLGVPNYLEPDRFHISNDFLNNLNIALPEKEPVPDFHPQYLQDSADTNIHLTEDAEIYVAFIHEGAGYKNTLGFFTYSTSEGAPETINSEDITIIFPNISYINGGGGLQSGDTVKIGNFTAGTSIGWFLIANGYSSRTGEITDGYNKFYSIDALNKENEPYKQHVVQLDFDDFIVLSFEDLVRPYGDCDFNDAVFTVISTPISAIDRTLIVENIQSSPTEITYSGTNNHTSTSYTPGLNKYGTLAFEDLWPHSGDYDFNDLVIDYNFIEYLNENSEIVRVDCNFIIKGILASMHNGFAIELPIPNNYVKSVSGNFLEKGYMQISQNGTEARQHNAIIPIFEDATLHFNDSLRNKLITVEVVFKFPVLREQLGLPPYNPFIMSNGERGREVHLPGMQPTDLAHYEYFSSEDDASILGTDYLYKDANNSPWALKLPESFSYPKDDVNIETAYFYFNNWVESKGSNYYDWYQDKPNYRNPNLIYD